MAVNSSFFGNSSGSSGGGFFSQQSSGSGGYGNAYGGGGSTELTPEEEEAAKKVTARRNQLGAVARLQRGNDRDREMAKKYLEDNQHLYTDDELAEYGLEKPGDDDRSLWEKAKGGAMGAVTGAMGVISRPQQFIAHSLNTVGTGLAGAVEVAQGDMKAGDFFGGMKEMTEDTFGSLTDIQGKGDINTREMLNLDKNAGGSGWVGDYVIGGLDMAGMIATDPLSWMGAGGTAGARAAGMKTVEKAAAEGLVRAELPQLLRTAGRKAITAEEEAVLRQLARTSAEEAMAGQRGRLATKFFRGNKDKTGGVFTRWKEGAIHDVATGAKEETGRLSARYWSPTGLKDEAGNRLVGAARVGEKNIDAILAGGQRGFKFGGQTLVSSAKYRGPLEKARLINSRPLVENVERGRALTEADEVAASIAKAEEHAAQAEAGKTAWSSKSSEALPEAVAARDEAEAAWKTKASELNDADPEVYVPPGMVPNPDLPKANQDYLRTEARLKQLEAEMAKLDEADLAQEAERKVLTDQLKTLREKRFEASVLIADQTSASGRDVARQVKATDEAAGWQQMEDDLQRRLDELDDNDDIGDRLADLNEEYERVALEQDQYATTPKEVYAEGRLDPNPELDVRKRFPVEDTNVYESGEGISPGTKSITAKSPDGKGLGTVDYYVDENGVVQIDNITTVKRGEGHGKKLIAKVEEETGQPASSFGAGDGVEEGSEGFWKSVTGKDTDPDTRQFIEPKMDAAGALGTKSEDELLNEIGDMIAAPRDPKAAAMDEAQRKIDLPPAHEAYGGYISQTPEGTLTIDGEPAEKLYRVVSNEEWAEAQRTGKLAGGEGSGYTRASALPDQRWVQEGGHVVEIRYDPTDAWSASAEGYAATKQPIDLSKVRDVGGEEQASLFAKNQDYAAAKKAERQAAFDAEYGEGVPGQIKEGDFTIDLGGPKPEAPAAAPKPAAPETRKSLAAQAQEAEREYNRAQRVVDRLEKKVGVTAEKQVARAERKLERLAERRARLVERQAALDERIPKMPAQVEDFIPSRIPGATKTQNVLRNAFVTGARVADQHGARTAQALKNLRELALGTAESRSNQAVRTLRNVLHSAAGEDRAFLDELPDIYRALEMGNADELAMQMAEAGRPRAAEAIRTFRNMNAEDTKAVVDEGFLPEDWLSRAGGKEGGGYMHRLETKEARKLREETERGTRRGSPARPASMNKADQDMGALHARTSHVGEVLSDDLQASFAAERGLPEGTKVIDDNPAASIGQHRVDLEHKRAAREFFEGAQELTDDAGLPLVTKDADLARTHGYVKVSTPEGDLWAPPAIADEVNRFQDVVYNDETIKAFGAVMDKTMRIWKAHATVPLVGFAFHARNAQTNMMLNWIAGVENPVWYARSAKLQLKLEKAMKQLGPETDIETLLAKGGLTAKEQNYVKLAQKHNVLATSQTAIDLADQGGSSYAAQLGTRAAEPGLKGRAKRAPGKLNFLNPETFVGTTSGRMVSGGLENNARLAHFMWAMDKYGDAEMAAQSVKKYLFNYADLTPFERRVMKRTIPFYTFMRKNTALMLKSTAENPGKMSRFAMAQEQLQDNTQGGPDFLKGNLIPNYVSEMGQGPTKAPGFGGLTTSIESPWSAASEVLAPAGEIAGMTPVLNRFVPGEFKGKGPEETALKLLNIPGGPVAEALKYTAERALGKDTFTGAPVKTMNPLGETLRLTDIFAPSPSKVARLGDKVSQGDVLGTHKDPVQGDERTRRRQAAVINALFGLNTNAVGPEATEAEVTRRFYELKDYLDVRNKFLEPGEKGYIPTIEELREEGIIPELPSKSKGGGGYGSAYGG